MSKISRRRRRHARSFDFVIVIVIVIVVVVVDVGDVSVCTDLVVSIDSTLDTFDWLIVG